MENPRQAPGRAKKDISGIDRQLHTLAGHRAVRIFDEHPITARVVGLSIVNSELVLSRAHNVPVVTQLQTIFLQ